MNKQHKENQAFDRSDQGEAFMVNGAIRDVHKFTASKLFGVPFAEVSDEQRRFAKTVNFGLYLVRQT